MTHQIVPESAPFNSEQRAWLNGFLAGMLGLLDDENNRNGKAVAMAAATSLLSSNEGSANHPMDVAVENESYPWHDSAMPLDERMKLAQSQPVERQMMAAMAQLDCGTCGYLCKTYAEAIANGSEKSLTLCSPGGSETAKTLRNLVKLNATKKATSNNHVANPENQEPKSQPESLGTRNHPVATKWIQSKPLNRSGSAKDTRHVEIDLTGTDLQYSVGDALGVWPINCDELVQSVIQASGLKPLEPIDAPASKVTVSEMMATRCLKSIPADLILRARDKVRDRPKWNGQAVVDAELVQQLESFSDSEELDQLDVLDFLERFPSLGLTAKDFAETLEPIRPRLYSIASSQSVYPHEVHLTVGRVESDVRGRARKGVASTMLSDRMHAATSVRVFVQKSHGFTIPTDPTAPMIMVGPGTGIAPFMAFLQQRQADQAQGENWLFFGDQRRDYDFLYQDQLESWVASGLLNRLDLAFSRDTSEKLYVQHRMKQNGAELYAWLERGSYFFVCGDASRMAVDVDRALVEIVSQHGGINAEHAKAYVQNLVKAKRYMRDVY